MKILIITGGSVEISFAAAFLKEYKYDMLMAVDRGIESFARLNIIPDMLIGDFDSADKDMIAPFLDDREVDVIRHKPEKDETDTELAIDKAIELKASEIDILGASGTRLDHTIGNIHCLYRALVNGVKCVIWDEHNRIELIDSYLCINKKDMYGKYVSFIPFTNTVTGLTLKGFKYNLDKYTLEYGKSIGISNEISDEKAYVELDSGILIYFQTKD